MPRMSRLERSVVWGISGGRCAYCGRQTGREQSADLKFTVDHAIPTGRGGKHVLSNWRPCCLACNELKSNLTEEEFLAIPLLQREAMRTQIATTLCRLGADGWWYETDRNQRCLLIQQVWASSEVAVLA